LIGIFEKKISPLDERVCGWVGKSPSKEGRKREGNYQRIA